MEKCLWNIKTLSLFKMQPSVIARRPRLSNPLTHSSLHHGTYRTTEKTQIPWNVRNKQRQDGSEHRMKCLGLKWEGIKKKKKKQKKHDFRNVTILMSDIDVKNLENSKHEWCDTSVSFWISHLMEVPIIFEMSSCVPLFVLILNPPPQKKPMEIVIHILMKWLWAWKLNSGKQFQDNCLMNTL